MNMHKTSGPVRLLFAILLTCGISTFTFAQVSQLPTEPQLRSIYDTGAYHACLQQISRLLALKGRAAAGVEREKLFLLRGDCLVKLRDSRTAVKAFAQAESSDDPDTSLRARAGLIILRS